MDSLAIIGIWLVIGLVVVSLIAIAVFGVRGFTHGKVSPMAAGAVLVPVLLLIVLGFSMGDWSQAAIYSLILMLVLTSLAMLLSSVRGVFGMN